MSELRVVYAGRHPCQGRPDRVVLVRLGFSGLSRCARACHGAGDERQAACPRSRAPWLLLPPPPFSRSLRPPPPLFRAGSGSRSQPCGGAGTRARDPLLRPTPRPRVPVARGERARAPRRQHRHNDGPSGPAGRRHATTCGVRSRARAYAHARCAFRFMQQDRRSRVRSPLMPPAVACLSSPWRYSPGTGPSHEP